jgi:hypothetical protein
MIGLPFYPRTGTHQLAREFKLPAAKAAFIQSSMYDRWPMIPFGSMA